MHYPAMAYYESFAKLRDRGVKIVATEHWTNVLCKDVTPDNMRSLKWFVDNADAFICVGEPLKQSVIELTGTSRQIDVVPNVVPPILDVYKRQAPGLTQTAMMQQADIEKLQGRINNICMGRLAQPRDIAGGCLLLACDYSCLLYTSGILHRMEELQELAGKEHIPVQLYPGNEILYRHGLAELLEQRKIRTLADSRYVLIEFFPGEDYSYIRDALGRVTSFGFWPVLALSLIHI